MYNERFRTRTEARIHDLLVDLAKCDKGTLPDHVGDLVEVARDILVTQRDIQRRAMAAKSR